MLLRTMGWLPAILVLCSGAVGLAGDGNRLAHLDLNDPYYVSRDFPKLTTPQWVGEAGVEAVVVLAIDDMRESAKYEAYLRPILQRLKQIDGRAGLSIMTNRIAADDAQLKQWLDEGLSIDVHTYDHPCPLLKGGDLEKARGTYERCVDLLNAIPGNRPVAYRMPCCDSLNTVSPRFFQEIFNSTTAAGKFLTIDTSVFQVFTSDDPVVGPAGFDADGRERFRKYVPYDRSFVNTVENYPYPYVIGGLCWEFPCVAPSDWSAQHLQQPNNPRTIDDWEVAIDLTVKKQGVFNLVFHPHGWIGNDQVVDLIDRTVKKHGSKVKFLSFRECQNRMDRFLLAGQPLRAKDGGDNGVRLLDVNADGYLDVVIANDVMRQTRIWSPGEKTWTSVSSNDTTGFPQKLVTLDSEGERKEIGLQFGVLSRDNYASVLFRDEKTGGGWRFDGQRWLADGRLLDGLEIDGKPVLTRKGGRDNGVRLRDLDSDGICEAVVGNPEQRAVFGYDLAEHRWVLLPFDLPAGTSIVRASGADAGLRFVDVDEDGFDDVIFSDETRYSLDLFRGMQTGWSERIARGEQGDEKSIPMIVRGETDNGAWFHSRTMWVQNEDTAELPNLVDRRAYEDLLAKLFPGPKSIEMSLKSMVVRPGFEVELVAGEPLVKDPVAFAWGGDGKFWVAEMADYPMGMDGQGKPGGRVRYLEDTDGDGKYDKSTLFLEGLNFPSGVMPWGAGVLVTAAPDIFYAADTDGDGRADERTMLFQGFNEGNQQHRVNGLVYGLDNRVYCANGDSGGRVTSLKTGEHVSISGADLRIEPRTGGMERLAGRSQFGRNRDSWGNWFGNNNSNPMYHFVLDDHYTRRNPHVASPSGTVQISIDPGAAPCFPVSRTLPRFNDFAMANRFTSACGAMVYDDPLFGADFLGNSFVSEPVHNLVHREIVSPDGYTFTSRRAEDEQASEFLASRDHWFRPTMLRTGPAGALYVADMYRRVIEHPEWVPDDWEAKLDVRAGEDRGRIYRVIPRGAKLRTVPKLAELSTVDLVAALDDPHRWQRDTAQRLLVERQDESAVAGLKEISQHGEHAGGRLQALWALHGLGELAPQVVLQALADPHPAVRRQAVRLSEAYIAESPELGEALLQLTGDADQQVLLQLAYALGEWDDPRSGSALGRLLREHAQEPFLVAAVMSSIQEGNIVAVIDEIIADGAGEVRVVAVMEPLLKLAAAYGDAGALSTLLAGVAKRGAHGFADWQFRALVAALEGVERNKKLFSDGGQDGGEELAAAMNSLPAVFAAAREVAQDDAALEEGRRAAVELLGRDAAERDADLALLQELLTPRTPESIQVAAVAALARGADGDAPAVLLAGWSGYSPALRQQVIDVLLQNESRTSGFLDAVEAGDILAVEIDAARRQRLLQHRSEPIQARAKKLLADSIDANRQQVIDVYAKSLVAEGDAQLGEKVFVKLCANCHRLQGTGHGVGPDLAALTDKSTPVLLTAIFDPNRAVEAKYISYTAVTEAGLSFSGILTEQTGNSLTLLAAEGKKQVVLRNELDELISTSKSLMPEGLEKDLRPEDVRHLTAYLQQARPPGQRRRFPGNSPGLATPSFDGTISLQARKSEVYGEELVYEKTFHNLGYWSNSGDYALWRIEVPQAGAYEVEIEWSCPADTAGNEFEIQAGDNRLTGAVVATVDWKDYKKARVGRLRLPAGRQEIVVRSHGPIQGYLFDLRSVTLIPVK